MFQSDVENRSRTISCISLSALVVILAAELITLAFSLWLLFRSTRTSKASEEAAPA